MNQSSLMAGALAAGFVFYLAMQGKLAAYWSILIGGSGAPAATGSTSAPGTGQAAGGVPGNPGLSANPFSGIFGGSGDPLFGPGAIFGPKATAPAAPASGAK